MELLILWHYVSVNPVQPTDNSGNYFMVIIVLQKFDKKRPKRKDMDPDKKNAIRERDRIRKQIERGTYVPPGE